MAEEEPLLKPNPRRFVLFPVVYEDIWTQYKKIEGAFCTDEVAPTKDTNQPFLARLLVLSSLFGEEGTMLKALASEIQSPEARCAFGMIEAQTEINRETFGRLLEPFNAHEDLLAAIFDSATEKAAWLRGAFAQGTFAKRLVLLGVCYSVFAAGVTAFMTRSAPPGVRMMNARAAIFRRKVVEFLRVLFCHVRAKPAGILDLVVVAVNLESRFIATLAVDPEVELFIQYQADHLLVALGQDPVYKAQNPFPELYAVEDAAGRIPKRFQKQVKTVATADRSLSFDEEF